MTIALDLAGARIDLEVEGTVPPLLEARYAGFAARSGPARWRLRLHPGPVPSLAAMSGRAVPAGATVRLEGVEGHGALDVARRCGDARLDPNLVIADALLLATFCLDVLERGGCLLHAAAVEVGGLAHVAPGRSGAGKTTFASLAASRLSDELCAVVPDRAGFRAHGTPWRTGRAGSAPIAAVWTLAWDGEGTEPLPPPLALRHLVTNLFLPVTGRSALETAFSACSRVASAVPFGRLAFRPDSRVDALLSKPGRPA